MMLRILSAILVLVCSCVLSGFTQPFKNQLRKLEIDTINNIYISYNFRKSVLLAPIYDFKTKQDSIQYLKPFENEEVNLISAPLLPYDHRTFNIAFSYGPSGDPMFLFYESTRPLKVLFCIPGLQLIVPCNGYLYVSGHTNNMFDKHKKFKIQNDTIFEIAQPFYYVGLKSITLKPLKLYSSQYKDKVIAEIPEKYPIQVLLNEFNPATESKFYLLLTELGLTGWFELPSDGENGSYIKGLFFNGD